MIFRLIMAAMQAFNGSPDAKLTGKQVAMGCALTVVVLLVFGLILPDSFRQLLRVLRFLL